MSVTVAINPFSDFEALHGINQDGQTEVVQIGRGKMSGSLTHISVDSSFGISGGSFSRGVRLRGVPSERRFMLGMVLATDGEATAWQQEVRSGDFLMVAPGQERYSAYQDATKFSAALVSPDELHSFLADRPGAIDEAAQLRTEVGHVDAATAANHVRNLSSLTEVLAEQGPSLPIGTVEFYKRNILEVVTAPIRHAVGYHGRQPRSYAALVSDVDRYLIEAGNRPVHISELCVEFNVSRRALHRAFMNVLGMPPIAFARRKRLCDVHEALSNPERIATVKQIAITHGFADLSRFATAYRRLFGELPSSTLRRRTQLPIVLIAFFLMQQHGGSADVMRYCATFNGFSLRSKDGHAAGAQALRDQRAAGVMAAAPRVAVAAALDSDPARIAVERMGERDRVDGAQQIGKPAQVFGGPDDGGFHFADRTQARQQPDSVLHLLGPFKLALRLLRYQVLPFVAVTRPARGPAAAAHRKLFQRLHRFAQSSTDVRPGPLRWGGV